MKIIQLIQKPQLRGAEIFACQLSNHLKELGHQVRLLSVFEGSAKMPFKGTIYSLKGAPERRFFDFSAWKRLAEIVKEFNPDVIQANAGDTLKYAVFSKLVFGWEHPVISRNASEVGRYLRSSLQLKINGFIYKKVAGVISVSERSKKDLTAHFSFLSDKTEVIPIGLETPLDKTEIVLEPAREKHILHVGGFTFEKNHVGVLRIFKSVLEKHDQAHLHLIGDGPLKSKLEDLVKKQNLSSKVTFYGFLDSPMPYINAADVLILPSLIEGLPAVLLEAMYVKTPVIAYNVGGISEIINNKTGVLISKGDEESFSSKVLDILKVRDEKTLKNAYKMISQSFDNSKIAVEFIKSYNKMSRWN